MRRPYSATASASPPLARLALILASCSLPFRLREPPRGARSTAAIYGLHEVRRVVSEGGRGAFDGSEDRSRALAFCWVSVGSALKHYAQMRGAPQGAPPALGADPVPRSPRPSAYRQTGPRPPLGDQHPGRSTAPPGPEQPARPKQPRVAAIAWTANPSRGRQDVVMWAGR